MLGVYHAPAPVNGWPMHHHAPDGLRSAIPAISIPRCAKTLFQARTTCVLAEVVQLPANQLTWLALPVLVPLPVIIAAAPNGDILERVNCLLLLRLHPWTPTPRSAQAETQSTRYIISITPLALSFCLIGS